MLDTTEMGLNEVLKRLGYTTKKAGQYRKTILKDGLPVRFPEGTVGNYPHLTCTVNLTADMTWNWLRATGEIK